jgi:hypothetical protein
MFCSISVAVCVCENLDEGRCMRENLMMKEENANFEEELEVFIDENNKSWAGEDSHNNSNDKSVIQDPAVAR